MHLPFDEGVFDAVVCQFGVMFFPEKSLAFSEARRVRRPGHCAGSGTWWVRGGAGNRHCFGAQSGSIVDAEVPSRDLGAVVMDSGNGRSAIAVKRSIYSVVREHGEIAPSADGERVIVVERWVAPRYRGGPAAASYQLSRLAAGARWRGGQRVGARGPAERRMQDAPRSHGDCGATCPLKRSAYQARRRRRVTPISATNPVASSAYVEGSGTTLVERMDRRLMAKSLVISDIWYSMVPRI